MAGQPDLGGVALLVKTRRRHLRFERLDGSFVGRDARFEIGDARLPRLAGLLALALFGEEGAAIVLGRGNRRDPRGARAARPYRC